MGVRAKRVLEGAEAEADASTGEGDLGGNLEGGFGSIDLLGGVSHGREILVFRTAVSGLDDRTTGD